MERIKGWRTPGSRTSRSATRPGKEVAEGAWWKAEQRLFAALQHCREGTLSVRCLELERRLAIFYGDMQRVNGGGAARARAVGGRPAAPRVGPGVQRAGVLSQVARSRNDLGSARAYLEEWMARGATQLLLAPRAARAPVLPGPAAGGRAARAGLADRLRRQPAWMPMFGATLAELDALRLRSPGRGVAEDRVITRGRGGAVRPGGRPRLRALSGGPLPPGPGPDPGRGAACRTPFAEADALPRGDALARESWALSYS